VVSVVPKNDKHAILQSIASSYRRAADASDANASNPTPSAIGGGSVDVASVNASFPKAEVRGFPQGK